MKKKTKKMKHYSYSIVEERIRWKNCKKDIREHTNTLIAHELRNDLVFYEKKIILIYTLFGLIYHFQFIQQQRRHRHHHHY